MRPPSTVPELPTLTPSEFRIFTVLAHGDGPLTIRDIGQRLAQQDPDFSQSHNALGILLLRMVNKGYVVQDPESGAAGKLYRAALPYDLALRCRIENLLDSIPLVSREDLHVLNEVVQDRLAAFEKARP